MLSSRWPYRTGKHNTITHRGDLLVVERLCAEQQRRFFFFLSLPLLGGALGFLLCLGLGNLSRVSGRQRIEAIAGP